MPGLKIICLKGRSYKKHVSLARQINHIETGARFYKCARLEPRPDLILCSYPLIELSYGATKLGRKWHVPVVLDIRDLWPDIFDEQFRGWKRLMADPLTLPFNIAASTACKRATAITGITDGILAWGANKAGRVVRDDERSFPHGYYQAHVSAGEQEEAEVFWEKYGVKSSDFIVSYFGAVNSRHEFSVVIDAAKALLINYPQLKFVICGSGDHLQKVRDSAKEAKNVIVPGWVPKLEMEGLARMSSLGLAPYKSEKNYLESVPTKAIEYFSHGLPVISSLKGRLANVLFQEQCGVTYENGSWQSLVDSIVDLLRNPMRLRSLGENSERLFKQEYDGSRVYGDMATHLEGIVDQFPKMPGI